MPDDPVLAERWLDLAGGGTATGRGRLERGRAGAARLVELLQFEPGRVGVRVPDGRGRGHDVSLAVPALDDARWAAVIDRVASASRHVAALLEGRVPGVLVEDDLLLPGAVSARCTCSQPRPCRHEAAVHHAIAIALDRDPTRIFRIRGRSVEDLLDAVRAARGGDRVETEDDVDLSAPFSARGDLDAVLVHPVPEPDVRTMFDQLGPPPGVDDPAPLMDLMAEAAALAWRLAAGEGADTADAEALLAELRAQGVASAASIASSLGLDPEAARSVLDELYSQGQVLRMGSGTDARYRAA